MRTEDVLARLLERSAYSEGQRATSQRANIFCSQLPLTGHTTASILLSTHIYLLLGLS